WRFKLYHHPIWTNARRVPMDACINVPTDACINYVLLRRLRRTVGAPGFSPFNYPQFCLLFQTFTKMPLKRLSSRPARSKLCPLFGSESSPNSSPKPLNSYLWVIERAKAGAPTMRHHAAQ